MEKSSAEPSDSIDDGGLEAVAARLGLWGKRTPPGLAQVEFVDEKVRRLVVDRLRIDLGAASIQFTEISLLTETPERSVADYLIERLRSTPAGVVSVDGLAAALPHEAPKLADSIYRLNVKRELLMSPSHRQIWWVPTYLAELLEKIAPDLESWIQLKLHLAMVGSPRQVELSGPTAAAALQPTLESAPFAADPVEARRSAEDALRRFRRAVEQGTPPSEGIRSLVRPAVDRLRRATLAEEAQELERRSREIALQHDGGKGAPTARSASIDLFISYTGQDRRWAVWLDFMLREAGYATKVQEYDFLPGQSFVEAMDQALVGSRFVVCLLSPGYLASRWCKEEWQAALRTNKLFLLRIADCDLDGVLAPHAYLDLVGASEAEAQARILAGLGKLEGKDPRPKVRPGFPGPAAAGLNSADPRLSFPGALPAIWNITEARNPYFTGRDEILRRLHAALGAGKAAALTQAISGLGGVGKTQLALEYAYRHAGEYAVVWWLRAETPATLADDYAALAPHLGVTLVADQGAVIREVRAELGRRDRILLVFDNATEPGSIKPYLPVGPGARVIVTTRAQNWPGAEAQDVAELAIEKAVEFLLKRSGQTDGPAAKQAAEEVAKRLGCLPLALEQAAAYVEACGKSLADYAALLEQRGLEVLEKGEPFQYERTVGTTWELAFEKVKAKYPAAVELLYFCAFLAPEAIPLKDLASAREKVPADLAKLLDDEVALDEAKKALLGFSLIRADGESLSIHRLVSEVIRKRMSADERERWLRAALGAVGRLFPGEPQDVRTWPQCERWLPHALTVVAWDDAEAVDASTCSLLLNRAGTHLWDKASYNEAEPLLRRALAIDEQSLGPNDPNVATAMNNLAGPLVDANRLAEAESLLRRALAIYEQSLGPNDPDVATAMNNLAELLRSANRLGEAEPLLRHALSIDEQSLGPNQPSVARDLNNLAMLLKATNRLGEAEPLYRRALAIDENSLGPDHPKTRTIRNNLDSVLAAMAGGTGGSQGCP